MEFIDSDGLSALLQRKGRWFFQKFHSRNEVKQIVAKFGMKVISHDETEVAWQLMAINATPLPLEQKREALMREFNLPLNSSGRTVNRHLEAVKILCE